jgi:hypothetical protein
MSQTQAQLVGNVVTGAVFAGIVTTTSANIGDTVGINSTGINVVGVITATSFSGDDINVSGIITATSFSGDGTDLDLSNNPTAGGSFAPVNYIIN